MMTCGSPNLYIVLKILKLDKPKVGMSGMQVRSDMSDLWHVISGTFPQVDW